MASRNPRQRSRRGWLLTLLVALVGVALGITALLLDGDLRAALAGGSIVCLVTAAICTQGVFAAEISDDAAVDFLEAEPPEPPPPQDQVTLIIDRDERDFARGSDQ